MTNKKTEEPRSLLSLMYQIITIGILLSGLVLVLALSPPANASGCKHNCEKTTTVVVNREDDDRTKHILQGIAVGAFMMCRAKAGWAGYKENRWWTWCGEREKPRPSPNPGPAPRNDITPDPVGVRLYQ